MTLIAWNGGPIFRNGAVGTEQACCCDPPPPPPLCDSCPDCEFPAVQNVTTYADPEGQCLVNWGGGQIVSQIQEKSYYRPPLNQEVFTLEFLPGAREAIEQCNWAIVSDQAYKQCCCEIPVSEGSTLYYFCVKTRWRLIFIECPEGGTPGFVDRTNEFTTGVKTQVTCGYDLTDDPPDRCIGNVFCYEYPEFLPDPTEPVCNEFP